MKIFYTASFEGKEKYQKYYDMVLKAIEKTEVQITSPEIGNYKEVMSAKLRDKIQDPKKLHYEAIRKGILLCDAVIIEISNEDFQLGHEATLAIQANKPVLCLSINENFAEKINNKKFFGAKYSYITVDSIVRNFIARVNKDLLNQRFNLFLTSSQLAYLEKAGKENNMNKSEYLRKLIDEDRENNVQLSI